MVQPARLARVQVALHELQGDSDQRPIDRGRELVLRQVSHAAASLGSSRSSMLALAREMRASTLPWGSIMTRSISA